MFNSYFITIKWELNTGTDIKYIIYDEKILLEIVDHYFHFS